MQEIVTEVQLLRELDHPHVVRLVDFYDEPQYYFIVTDMVRGGDLFMRIIDKARYMETEARDVVKSLLEVLHYLHRHGVAHRDIKVCGSIPAGFFVLLLLVPCFIHLSRF
jgi:serine/threonine protein kinase